MIAVGPHGGDGARLAAALGVEPGGVLDLSASLNPVAPDVRAVVAAHLDALDRYPDPEPAREALAAALDVEPGRVLLTNGGSEAIALVTAGIGGHVEEPEFALHPRGTGPRWRSDPHNPSGRLAAPGEVAGVWDEAFYPLATGRWTGGRAASVVVGSLTKVFACPGLRIGYVVVPERPGVACSDPPALMAALRRAQPAWAVNGLAAAVLPTLLERADLPGWAASVAELRRELVDLLGRHGFDPAPSDANWVLVRARGLRDRLACQGVLVRDCTSFGLPDVVRIAVPPPGGHARLAAAFDAVRATAVPA